MLHSACLSLLEAQAPSLMSLACRLGHTLSPTAGLGAKGRSPRPRNPRLACTAAQYGGQGSPLELPGGAGVWLGNLSSGDSFMYGSAYSFVIRREKIGGEGLVLRPAGPKPLHVKQQRASGQLAPRRQPGPQGLMLAGLDIASCSVVIDTSFEVVDDRPAVQPNTTCTGIVHMAELSQQEEPARSKHRRRTQKVSFTCNLCGTPNLKETNPHAWQRGSVFMRCEGCSAVHKLRDNLKIFHELKGPVFPPRHLRNSFLVQEILDKIKAKKDAERQQGSSEGGLLN